MRDLGFTLLLDLVRRAIQAMLLTAFMVVLASCTGTPKLTDGRPVAASGNTTVPPIAIQQVAGIPPDKLAELKTAMALAGGQRDIGIVEGSFQSGNLALSGEFKALLQSAGVRVLYRWELRDASGVLVQTIDGEDNAGLFAGADPWGAVSSSVLDRIARRTTETMATKLSKMGYATRLTALHVPPSELFAQASPDAQREIDFETLNGPGMAMAGMDMITPNPEADLATASIAPAPDGGGLPLGEALMLEAQMADVPEPMEPDPIESAPRAKASAVDNADGKTAIRAVAVMRVSGSPGGGDAELTAAMRKTLSEAGWPVVSAPQPDALNIVGHVKVTQQKGAEQSVSVRWEVQSPDGKPLGDVKQANRVPNGALDRGWGPAAFAVAEAAATGIFDIVNRFQ